MALKARQLRFCQEYLIDLNGSRAAVRAGYSEVGCATQAGRLLMNAEICSEIAKLRAAQEKRLEITADRVLKEWGKIAFANLGDYLNVHPDGTARVDLSEMTPEQAAALSEVTVDQYTEGNGKSEREVKKIKIKLADKKGALDSIAKHLGMFTNKELDPEGFKLIFSSVLDE